MTTVFSSDVRDLVSRYHRDVLSLRAQLAQETTAAPTSLYKPRAAQIHIGAARMDTCENLKTALKSLEETFIHNVQSKLHSERQLELKQLEDDFEEEVLALTSSSVNQSDQDTATSTKFESPTNTIAATATNSTPHPAAQFGTKMSLLPLKPNPKSKAPPTTNNNKNQPAASTIAALTNTATTTAPAAAAATHSRTSTTSTALPGAGSIVTTGNGTATRNSHSSTTTTTSSRLCNTARDALNEAKRLSIVGAYGESASAFRHAGKVQDAYTYRNSIPKNPRLHFGDTASVGQLRSSNQRLINASQRNVLRTEMDEKHLKEAIEEVKRRYQNAQERLRHRHTVEQHAAVSLAQLAMSAPAEEKHCSAIQRTLQKRHSANNINNSSTTTGDALHDRNYYDENDISGVASDPDEMYTPYRVGSSRSSHNASRGGGYYSSTKAPAALRLSPALLGQQPYTTSAATSRPASAAAVRNMYGRPQTSGGEGHYYSRPPTAGRVTATRSSPSRARSPFALHSADVHTAGHNHAVVATSGSVLDGVAAPPPFGTRPPSSKVASGTSTTSNSAASRRHLLPRPQSAGGGVGTVGGSRPQTAHARLGLPHPTQHVSTPSSSLVALCDAYGDLFVEEDNDDVDNNNGSDNRGEDVYEEVRSHLASNQHNHNQTRVRSATATTTSESKYVQGGSGSRHNPRVNVTGTRYLQAVASLNRLHNNNTPNSVVIYE